MLKCTLCQLLLLLADRQRLRWALYLFCLFCWVLFIISEYFLFQRIIQTLKAFQLLWYVQCCKLPNKPRQQQWDMTSSIHFSIPPHSCSGSPSYCQVKAAHSWTVIFSPDSFILNMNVWFFNDVHNFKLALFAFSGRWISEMEWWENEAKCLSAVNVSWA